jgi:hypothetical protein
MAPQRTRKWMYHKLFKSTVVAGLRSQFSEATRIRGIHRLPQITRYSRFRRLSPILVSIRGRSVTFTALLS